MGAAWASGWKGEVSVDVGGDGKVEFCDPGQWQGPTGDVAGTVTDSSGAGIGSAVVVAVGTSNPQLAYSATTAAGGTYTISNVEPANYDFTVSKAGYNSQSVSNQPVLPFQTSTVDFQLGVSAATLTGFVRNVSGSSVAGVVVKVLGTSLSAVTAVDGSYSISNVPVGSYDLTASKVSDGYEGGSALNVEVVSGTVAVDFTLLRALGSCEDDCTAVGSNLCDASCHGKGLCWFYSEQTMQACDG
ncbi:carboxypeptidase regulatory-like domain-containing protein, partial [Candidatus Woesearchaeota archaeon]|nr:carboxypeptidase regulatory-like domain-containing protein [Candidatus Woesearchaeota archaeon]